MIKPTNTFAAILFGALAVLAIAPATAFGENPSDPGGCDYTDADGATIALRNGEDASVDRKVVSCRGGSIVVTMPAVRSSHIRGPLVPVPTQATTSEPDPLTTPKRMVLDTVPIRIGTL
ncbi:hypothetical protein AB4Z42_19140 [Mycobacterium sp. 2YAF39]|uniref:hypothetical protein n=1 Tax=Mycobacterium sp. 2YAF39 TaxID=3233033 RepID=UPI003F977E37